MFERKVREAGWVCFCCLVFFFTVPLYRGGFRAVLNRCGLVDGASLVSFGKQRVSHLSIMMLSFRLTISVFRLSN